MAATDAKPFPAKNAAYRYNFYIFNSSGDPVTGATGLDSEVSKDNAGFNDCSNEATEVGNGQYYIDLTAPEMNADHVAFVCKSNGKQVCEDFYPMEEDDADLWFLRIAKRDMSTVTGESARSFLNALRLLRNKFEVDGSNVLHVKKEDDSTDAWTSQLTTSASAAPIVSSDPA